MIEERFEALPGNIEEGFYVYEIVYLGSEDFNEERFTRSFRKGVEETITHDQVAGLGVCIANIGLPHVIDRSQIRSAEALYNCAYKEGSRVFSRVFRNTLNISRK
ncbi:hypothetical protein GF386_02800 [Candidatus Pacearchaeota archaeon]|nr:hypothetical protein [Candidatus Pacearchaeota archaeon]MBD3283077.1 hypothetical protein [Candidatus Pacearchaeota archaeon]